MTRLDGTWHGNEMDRLCWENVDDSGTVRKRTSIRNYMSKRINTHMRTLPCAQLHAQLHARTCLSALTRIPRASMCAHVYRLSTRMNVQARTTHSSTQSDERIKLLWAPLINMTWHDRTGYNTKLHDRTGQDRTGQDMTGNEMTWSYRIGKDRPTKDMTWNDMTGQDRTGHYRTGNNITWNIMK